ncbi:MAG: hypothetical protein ACRD1Z_19560 [Vicinamibacteria bacterium]
MRTTNLLLGCTLSLLVLASTGAPSDRKNSAERKSTNACTAIQVTAPDAPPQTKRRSKKKAPTFSASSILDLKLEAAVKGQHQLEFKVYTPKGHLYQSLTAAMMGAPTASDGRRQRESQKRTASATLPVAGTTIVTNSLYGEWKVEAYLDGERDTACAKPRFFVIAP